MPTITVSPVNPIPSQEVDTAYAPDLVNGFAIRKATETDYARNPAFGPSSYIIQLKRGNKANLPTLSSGEPAVCLDTGEVFAGVTSGNVAIGSPGYTGQVTTTDATATTLCSVDLADDTVYYLEAYVTALNKTGGKIAAFKSSVSYYRLSGGGPTLNGSISADHTFQTSNTWSITFDSSSNTVRVRVTGAAATTVEWDGKLLVTSRRTWS